MKITATRTSLSDVSEDVLIVPVFEGETALDGSLASLDHLTSGAVERLFEDGDISGKRDRWALLRPAGSLTARRVLLYGAGKADHLTALSIQRFSGAAIRALKARSIRSVGMLLRGRLNSEVGVRAIIEGAVMGQMDTGLYRASDEPLPKIELLHLVSETPEAQDFDAAIKAGTLMAEAVNFARTLGFEPGNVMTPTELARRAEEMASREGLKFESLDEQQMKALGMGTLLAVARGSQEPARLIHLTYEPEGEAAREGKELIALLGKGITFDSGGISIKPADKMEEMKYDMGGGAAVIGAMQVIARLKPPIRVIGLVPATENLPSGRAVKPGDVVRSLSGKTVEVVNTDAEGRLVLADAITYAISLGATEIVDAATLTGACVIALGEHRAGVMGNAQRLIDDLIEAGEQSGERLWQLPLDKEYGELIASDIADVKNIGNRTAGAITAAYFLKHFAGDLPWAHLDIAGTAWTERARPYLAKGATGFGVRVLATYVLNRANSTG
jgi:leucyl aminopeptidase